jgi:LPXTG-motif cell wall-anchored protein
LPRTGSHVGTMGMISASLIIAGLGTLFMLRRTR